MTQAIRQSELFQGNDWTVLYRAFNQINFNSYDPQSINAALRDYIQSNYPEDFNDWIESSEFVAIIDLLSWLAGSLAFRTDVNARENFLETAQARESVLRLARFLSYNPRRAQSARGFVKITEVKTTQSIMDSFGVNLNNRAITWNDPDNLDWQEQFILIMNATFPITNSFGVPFKKGTFSGTGTQLYRMNTPVNQSCTYPFSSEIDGLTQNFELVNVDFSDDGGFSERNPDPANAFNVLYRNDGKGFGSARTGFFAFFKQGSLNQQMFNIVSPIENRLIDIDTANISETDVWVQTIDNVNTVTINWDKVPAIFNENITFNDFATNVRNIFSVVTRDNDNVTLRFGDGRFGNVPVGNLKVWYRVVNGLDYQIRPRDMENISISMPYTDRSGRQQVLTCKISLEENITNAISRETIEQIRTRAPQVYGTQNRMVSGEDYNVFPMSSNAIVKMHAVNRVYSGHSRYVNISDPTATLQDTVVFSDDGMLYRETTDTQNINLANKVKQYNQISIAANFSPEQIITRRIQPMLDDNKVMTYMSDFFINNLTGINHDFNGNKFKWIALSGAGYSGTGCLDSTKYAQALSSDKTILRKYMSPGSQLKFRYLDSSGDLQILWTKVLATELNKNISGFDPTASQTMFDSTIIDPSVIPITVDETVPFGAFLLAIIPPYRSKLDYRTMLNRTGLGGKSEMAKLESYIFDKTPFYLYYVYDTPSQIQFSTLTIAGQWIIQHPSDTPPANGILVLTSKFYSGLFWSFSTEIGLRYIFESVTDVRWHDLKLQQVVDQTTGRNNRDSITISMPTMNNKWNKVKFDIVDNVYDIDGMQDARKVVVAPTDSDNDGQVDNPSSFQEIVSNNDRVLFVQHMDELFQPLYPVLQFNLMPSTYQGDSIYINGLGLYTWDISGAKYILDPNTVIIEKQGVENLKYQWQHFAGTDIRIDPAISNIIDIFVLTSEYDSMVRQWITDGTPDDEFPVPPTALDLQLEFTEFTQYKMFSDQLVWRPVKYKYLFGNQSLPELRAQFKIVRLSNSTLSDGEIQSKVIQTINTYFDVNKWEFGETFYFTELAAFIHMQLATAISSVVIVPLAMDGLFGELFEVRCEANEVFISTAQVSDIVLIDNNSMANLRIS